jgi:hypothetical protein
MYWERAYTRLCRMSTGGVWHGGYGTGGYGPRGGMAHQSARPRMSSDNAACNGRVIESTQLLVNHVRRRESIFL